MVVFLKELTRMRNEILALYNKRSKLENYQIKKCGRLNDAHREILHKLQKSQSF